MSFERVKNYLAPFGLADRCIDLKDSSATVALAAQALGTEEARIAKTMSFLLDDTPLIVVVAGDAPPAVAPFAVAIDDLLRDIAETRRRTREFESAFAAHPSIHIAYEDLATDPQAQCDRVFDFLGVGTAPVRVATERIVRTPPETLVLNYGDVQAALRAGEA